MRDLDAIALEKERDVRRKVVSIYNKGRRGFTNTPDYNLYLEKREEMIYALAYESNEPLKKEIQNDLNTYKADNIHEHEQQRKNEENDFIRQIVEEEGDFYERVKEPYVNGFHRANRELIVHPLKREFRALFEEHVPQQGAATGAPQPLKGKSMGEYNEEFNTLLRLLGGREKPSKEQKRAGGWTEGLALMHAENLTIIQILRREGYSKNFLGVSPLQRSRDVSKHLS